MSPTGSVRDFALPPGGGGDGQRAIKISTREGCLGMLMIFYLFERLCYFAPHEQRPAE